MAPESSKSLPSDGFQCQQTLLDLFDDLPGVLFCAKDLDGRYLYVNDGFLRRSGKKSKRHVIGKKARDIFAPQRAELYEKQDAVVLTTGRAMRDELELIRRPSGLIGWHLTSKLAVAETGTITGLVSVSKDLEASGEETSTIPSLNRVIDYVQTHLAEPLRVGDLAQIAGCSTSQLTRRLKGVVGLTPNQFVVRARVDRATDLLTASDHPLAEVATRSGFYDQANLTHHFGRYTGLTPAEYRASRGADLR